MTAGNAIRAEIGPAGLTTQPQSIAAGKDAAILWPVLTSLLLAIVFVAIAALSFRRKDL